MTTRDASELIQAIREVALKRPGTTYANLWPDDPQPCTYLKHTPDGDVPGCLIGHGLAAMGMLEHPGVAAGNTDWVPILLPEIGIAFTPAQMKWLTSAQRHQDAGATWWQAVREADLATTVLTRQEAYDIALGPTWAQAVREIEKATTVLSPQEAYDVAAEKRLERAADFESNFE